VALVPKETGSAQTAAGAIEGTASTGAQERCIKSLALNARRNARFLSSRLKESRSIAKNALKSTGPRGFR